MLTSYQHSLVPGSELLSAPLTRPYILQLLSSLCGPEEGITYMAVTLDCSVHSDVALHRCRQFRLFLQSRSRRQLVSSTYLTQTLAFLQSHQFHRQRVIPAEFASAGVFCSLLKSSWFALPRQ